MSKKKYRRMTQKEKDQMKVIRKELREKGALPPVKKRLNRKAYIDTTMEMWREPEGSGAWMYLTKAVSWVMGKVDAKGNVHPEAVGAAKVARVAMKLHEFERKKKEEGKDTYTTREVYEFIRETLDE